MGSILKYLMVAVFIFGAFNEFVMMRRPSAFNNVTKHQTKAEVAGGIGDARYAYQCGSGPAVALYAYIDNLCAEKVTEVDAYPLCYIQLRCPGWNYVGYDQDGKVLSKYHFGN